MGLSPRSGLSGAGHSLAGGASADVSYFRITSYNVCYTKLLRLAGVVALALGLTAGLTPATAQEIKQGGSMIVTYKDDVSTLDPAIGYDWQNWSMIKSLFDGVITSYSIHYTKLYEWRHSRWSGRSSSSSHWRL